MSYSSIPMPLLRLKVRQTDLTALERDVLRLLARGCTQLEVAKRRGTSIETVRKQTKMIRARLDAKTTAEAVAVAVSLDLI